MRLVDGDEPEVHAVELVGDARAESLGRRVHELELTTPEGADTLVSLLRREARVEEGGANSHLLQRVHLVLHQRDERRHDQRGSPEHPSGDLERDRLPRARRHDPDAIATGEHGVDDLLLARAELRVAEDLRQHVLRIWGVRRKHSRDPAGEGAEALHDVPLEGVGHPPPERAKIGQRLGDRLPALGVRRLPHVQTFDDPADLLRGGELGQIGEEFGRGNGHRDLHQGGTAWSPRAVTPGRAGGPNDSSSPVNRTNPCRQGYGKTGL